MDQGPDVAHEEEDGIHVGRMAETADEKDIPRGGAPGRTRVWIMDVRKHMHRPIDPGFDEPHPFEITHDDDCIRLSTKPKFTLADLACVAAGHIAPLELGLARKSARDGDRPCRRPREPVRPDGEPRA